MKFAVLAIALSLALPCVAQTLQAKATKLVDQRIGFKGITPGVDASVAQEQIESAGIMVSTLKAPLMKKTDAAGNVISKTFSADFGSLTLAECPIKNLIFTYAASTPEPKLSGISIFFNADNSDTIKDALAAKYGEPIESSRLSCHWLRNGCDIVWAKYIGDSYDTGVVGFDDHDLNKKIEARMEAKAAADL